MSEEQLNEPEWPTQMQIDTAFIQKLMLALSECHYFVNRSLPEKAVLEVRATVEKVKGDSEWRRRFKRMGSPNDGGSEHG